MIDRLLTVLGESPELSLSDSTPHIVDEELARSTELQTVCAKYISSPDLNTALDYFNEVFVKKSRTYRTMTLNFIAPIAVDCISVPFLCYYKSVIINQTILDSRGNPIEISYEPKIRDKWIAEKERWHFKYVIGNNTIFFAWNRLQNDVIQIVFSCDEALFTSTADWAELVASCK